jgi:hypothetical protein
MVNSISSRDAPTIVTPGARTGPHPYGSYTRVCEASNVGAPRAISSSANPGKSDSATMRPLANSA